MYANYVIIAIMAIYRSSVNAKAVISQFIKNSVSYTHLDVYKRQMYFSCLSSRPGDVLPSRGHDLCLSDASIMLDLRDLMALVTSVAQYLFVYSPASRCPRFSSRY